MKAAAGVLLLALAVVAIAGPAGQLAVSSLPWLSDAMKAPCAKSEFEYRLATGRLSAEPVKVCPDYDAISIIPEVKSNGLLVRVVIRLRPGQQPVIWGKYNVKSGTATRWTAHFMAQRFGDASTFPDSDHIMLALFLEGDPGQSPQLVATCKGELDAEYVPLKATPAQQAEFLNRLTSQADAPTSGQSKRK